MQNFDKFSFDGPLTAGARTQFDVYVKGQGNPVLLMQELPGIDTHTLALVERLNAAGYRVYLPHFLGKIGKSQPRLNTFKALFCLRKEFWMFSQFKSSPISNWLRALCGEINLREGGAGVGVIGMCLTGNFALLLMADTSVIGAVACQPALPARHDVGLHLSRKETAETRLALKEKNGALVMAYDNDPLCPLARIKEIESTFKPFIEIHVFRGDHHSTLTRDYGDGVRDAAFATAIDYLAEKFQHLERA